ncbi:hypothetical protein GF340_01785 [Candidatus Peregrinibacteria bacterium]|nr:hypothetical protein [Candidatus Peregrinibacteria bacterium]
MQIRIFSPDINSRLFDPMPLPKRKISQPNILMKKIISMDGQKRPAESKEAAKFTSKPFVYKVKPIPGFK